MAFRILLVSALVVVLVVLGFLRHQGGVEADRPAPARASDALVRVEQGPEAHVRHAALLEARAPEPTPAPASEPVGALEPLAAPAPAPRPIAALRVLVQDDEGDPVADVSATLTVLPGDLANRAYWPAVATADATPPPAGEGLQIRAVSDPHGELRFEGVPWSRRVRIDIAANGDFANASALLTTHTVRLSTLVVSRTQAPLVIRVEGVPAELGDAWMVVRNASGRAAWSVPLTTLSAYWVGALDGEGRAVVPGVPEGDLAADLVVPGVGMWRGLRIVREAGGMARVGPDPTETATVAGVLRGPDGRVVGGACLALAVTPFLQRTPPRSWIRWARSDEEGRFVLENVPVGRVKELYVVAEGFVAPRLILENAPLRPGDVLDAPLQLIPACSVAGRVIDAEGQGRAGVRVRPSSSNTDMMLWDPPATWTDASGRYRLDGLPPGAVTLTASEVGQPGRVNVEVVAAADRLVRVPGVVLAATEAKGRVELFVVDREGRPVSGASIGIRTKHAEFSGTVYTGPTDPAGRFEIDGVAAGAERIEVWAYKRGAVSQAFPVEPAEVDAATASVQIVLPPVGRVRGRVLCEGEPVRGLRVEVVGTRVRATSDAAGRFVLQGVPVGWQTLRVATAAGADASAPTRVDVPVDETVEVDLEVPPDRPEILLRGRLLDGAGRPLVGVDVQTGEPQPFARGDSMPTDAEGRFALPVASRHDQTLRSGDRVLHPRLSPAAEPVDVVFDPSRLQVVEGRILDREGRQATAGQVHVTVDDSGRNPEAHAGGGFFRMELAAGATGHLQVHARHSLRDGAGQAFPGTCEPVTFEPDGVVVLTPRPLAGRPRIHQEGHVVDPEGRPIQGARVELASASDPDADDHAARSAEDGLFTVERLPPGPLVLRVWGPPGYAWTTDSHSVSPAAGPVGITLSRASPDSLFTARVQALDADDLPVPDAPLRLWAPNLAHSLSGRTDAEGRCAFENVPREEVSVGFAMGWEAPGYAAGDRAWHAEVSPESNDEVLRLPRRRRDPAVEHDVEIRLVDPRGEVLPDTRPSVRLRGVGNEEGSEYRNEPFAFMRGSTRTVLRGVRAGTYRLQVTLSGIDSPYLPIPEREIPVPFPPIEVELVRAAELHGVVEGDDVEGYQVRLWFDDGASWVGRTISSSGAFAFYVDPAAVATVTAHHPGRAAYARRADVVAGDAPVRLSLDLLGLEIKGRLVGLKAMPERYDLRLMGDHYGTNLELDDDFGFHAQGVPPGTYRLSFSSHDFDAPPEQSRATAEAQAGDTEVVLRLSH